jgi:hypothetical protein
MNDECKEGDTTTEKSPWNSLEISKLVVSILTPLLLAYVGYLISSVQSEVARSREDRTQLDRKVAEADLAEKQRIREFRLELYKDTGPLLNDIFAYHFYVGNWREFTPTIIIGKKRTLDTRMYSHESLFTRTFFDKYRIFMSETFREAGEWHSDSKLRTLSKCRQKGSNEDDASWRARFTNEDNRRGVCLAYRNLLDILSTELLFLTLQTKDTTDEHKLEACPKRYDTSTCP